MVLTPFLLGRCYINHEKTLVERCALDFLYLSILLLFFAVSGWLLHSLDHL